MSCIHKKHNKVGQSQQHGKVILKRDLACSECRRYIKLALDSVKGPGQLTGISIRPTPSPVSKRFDIPTTCEDCSSEDGLGPPLSAAGTARPVICHSNSVQRDMLSVMSAAMWGSYSIQCSCWKHAKPKPRRAWA